MDCRRCNMPLMPHQDNSDMQYVVFDIQSMSCNGLPEMQYASYASAMSAPLSKIILYRRFAIFCLWYTKYVMQWITSICLLRLCTTLTTMKKIICTNSEKLSENIQKAKKRKEKEFATLWNYGITGEKLKSITLVLNSPRSQQYSNIADRHSPSVISEFAT